MATFIADDDFYRATRPFASPFKKGEACGFAAAKLSKPLCGLAPPAKQHCGGVVFAPHDEYAAHPCAPAYKYQHAPCHKQVVEAAAPVTAVPAAVAAPYDMMMTTKSEKMVQKKSSSWLWWVAGIVVGLLLLWLAWALLKNYLFGSAMKSVMGNTGMNNILPINANVPSTPAMPADAMAAASDAANASAMASMYANETIPAGQNVPNSPAPYLTPGRPYVSPPPMAAANVRPIPSGYANYEQNWNAPVCCEDDYLAWSH